MTRRSKEQLDRDRADLVAVLEDAGTELRTDVLICRAQGLADPGWHDSSWWPYYTRAHSDLRALAKAGRVVCVNDTANSYYSRWRLATPQDLDVEADRREVARMYAGWTEDL